jgi:hypothetical protein
MAWVTREIVSPRSGRLKRYIPKAITYSLRRGLMFDDPIAQRELTGTTHLSRDFKLLRHTSIPLKPTH